MNLETIEQRCLAYLAQTSAPLVPVSRLLRHLRNAEGGAEKIPERDLLDFLRKHELFKVIEAPEPADDKVGAVLEKPPQDGMDPQDLGDPQGPSVILRTRIPTPPQLLNEIELQLDRMTAALHNALEEADDEGDIGACNKVREIIARTAGLREKFGKIGAGPS